MILCLSFFYFTCKLHQDIQNERIHTYSQKRILLHAQCFCFGFCFCLSEVFCRFKTRYFPVCVYEKQSWKEKVVQLLSVCLSVAIWTLLMKSQKAEIVILKILVINSRPNDWKYWRNGSWRSCEVIDPGYQTNTNARARCLILEQAWAKSVTHSHCIFLVTSPQGAPQECGHFYLEWDKFQWGLDSQVRHYPWFISSCLYPQSCPGNCVKPLHHSNCAGMSQSFR